MRLAAAADETYQANVVELEKEMGISSEGANESAGAEKIDNRAPSIIYREAVRLAGSNPGEITKPYKIKVPLTGMMNLKDNNGFPAPETTVTFEFIPFGSQGATAIADLDFHRNMENATFSWSSKDLHLIVGEQQGTEGIVLVQGSSQIIGGLLCQQDCWILLVNTNGYMNRDFHRGMTPSEVEKVVSQLSGGKFKFSRKEGKYDIYTFYWLGQKDYYSFRKGAVVGRVNNNAPFGHFYFSKGKLDKWIFVYDGKSPF